MSSLVSSGDTTPALGSFAMTSAILRLLEAAFTADYNPYGIPDSPTGSLVSLDDATEVPSGSTKVASGSTVSCSPSPIPDVEKASVPVGGAPSISKSVDQGLSKVPASLMVNTTSKQDYNTIQSLSPKINRLCMELDVMAEETGFAVCVARNVWERCRDLETTLIVLQAMRDAANSVCVAATGRAPIT